MYQTQKPDKSECATAPCSWVQPVVRHVFPVSTCQPLGGQWRSCDAAGAAGLGCYWGLLHWSWGSSV